ncbi:GPI-anchored protein [Rhynchospora pubera]|uniref:GPI-anchored protein n=1 Tax=Rhynchospora pubera TaxID=906938 RepID=A0AAV8BZM4_9POAL|nr:GPI-anchored protein [Rhynchospora pubera]
MECLIIIYNTRSTFSYRALLLFIYIFNLQHALSRKSDLDTKNKFILSDPPMGILDPIEISPATLPRNAYPAEPLSPMVPTFPSSYQPNLTGRCPVNFTQISPIIEKTASDCSVPLAAFVGDVICCPQVNSLMHIFQSTYTNGTNTDALVLNKGLANDCFSDMMNILASKGASSNITNLCTVAGSNLTSMMCPVKDVSSFEKAVNVSKLLDACSNVDPLKECCRPACGPAIMEAAMKISMQGGGSGFLGNDFAGSGNAGIDMMSDCKGVVYAWLARKLSLETANSAFRMMTGCKVNKVCPLEFEDPSPVTKACSNTSSLDPAVCCSAFHAYIKSRKKQIIITNIQAINCATMFGSMLQKSGVKTDLYELCDIDLKDFSLQAFGQQGCLLRSLPTDIIYDNLTGMSFTCDLSDNIAAPWPSSSSVSSLSLCAPEMSLPALPVPQISGSQDNGVNRKIFVLALALFASTIAL